MSAEHGLNAYQIMDLVILGASIIALLAAISREIIKRDKGK